jgi:hypothetical protein
MAKRVTPDEIHAWFKEYFRQRLEIGFGNAMSNLALEPRNPFEPKRRRRPKRWSTAFLVIVGVGIVLFSIFNFVLAGTFGQ